MARRSAELRNRRSEVRILSGAFARSPARPGLSSFRALGPGQSRGLRLPCFPLLIQSASERGCGNHVREARPGLGRYERRLLSAQFGPLLEATTCSSMEESRAACSQRGAFPRCPIDAGLLPQPHGFEGLRLIEKAVDSDYEAATVTLCHVSPRSWNVRSTPSRPTSAVWYPLRQGRDQPPRDTPQPAGRGTARRSHSRAGSTPRTNTAPAPRPATSPYSSSLTASRAGSRVMYSRPLTILPPLTG